jgi:Holliday junction resolvasome RuvABC ATP-dependent DNA helicase subunit
MKVLARRMVQASKAPGFTNGWHVRNLVDQVLERQGRRMKEENVAAENKHHFTRQDLLGPDPQIDLSLCPAWIELQNMVGLKQVKESILNLHQIVLGNMEREKVGLPKLDISLNRMILGNPGTGKTTVGYLYGQILKHLGLLSDGSVVIKKPSDFISKNLGGSEANTKAILRSTIGKVLIIDEAYSLMGDGNGLHSTDSFNAAVIDTIISEVQNVPGEDRCVLLLGYREQMESMLTNANPGLSRRFLPENSLIINDYTDAELVQIFNGKLKKRALKAGIDTQLAAWDALKKDARRPNFGNAGAVENLISTSIQRMQGRIRPLPISEQAQSSQLLPVDVNPDWKPSTDILLSDIDIEDLLKDFVGFEDVVEQLNVYKSTIAMALQSGRDPMVDVPMNYLFVGPPGTGKTSLARRFAKIFHSFGLLATDDVVEVSASNLVAGFVGQTAILTKQVLKKGLGRILFIDEAYRLRPDRGNSFAKEALDEIVDQLTKPEFHGKLVVILAGYEADIHSLLDANPGLSSRFPEQIKFAHLEPPVCCDLLERQLQEKGFKIDTWNPQQRGTLINTLTRLSQTKNWGNGRDIQTLSQRIVRTFARRTLQSKGEMLKMCPTMILDCAKQFLSERLEMTKNQAMKQNSSRYPGLQTASLDMTVACRAKKINDREPPSSKEGEDKSPKGKSKKKRSKRNSKTDEHLNNSGVCIFNYLCLNNNRFGQF